MTAFAAQVLTGLFWGSCIGLVAGGLIGAFLALIGWNVSHG